VLKNTPAYMGMRGHRRAEHDDRPAAPFSPPWYVDEVTDGFCVRDDRGKDRGRSSLDLVEAVSMAIGRDLLSEEPPRRL
jgi:hypothetical protein